MRKKLQSDTSKRRYSLNINNMMRWNINNGPTIRPGRSGSKTDGTWNATQQVLSYRQYPNLWNRYVPAGSTQVEFCATYVVQCIYGQLYTLCIYKAVNYILYVYTRQSTIYCMYVQGSQLYTVCMYKAVNYILYVYTRLSPIYCMYVQGSQLYTLCMYKAVNYILYVYTRQSTTYSMYVQGSQLYTVCIYKAVNYIPYVYTMQSTMYVCKIKSSWKSEIQHTGTWSAQAQQPRCLWYRPAVFFRLLRLIGLFIIGRKNLAL